MRLSKILIFCFIGFLAFTFCGCQGTFVKRKKAGAYVFPELEAEWIRAGEPIKFEAVAWFPQDDVDVFLDEEMLLLGEYRDVEFFVYKVDIQPYQKIYTKFGKNKFRIYEQKSNN